ncbi:laccase [Rhodofomes roseus]|uniref:laccase n=1 Tax=Rhodofomes roseus TaxID=34475 RepID=A0ABQ8KMV4_9APHY|nr:laccase [Rhodofomes roseus]KAH9839744.1 laccase [Rhodofomes roseus]
MSQSSLLSGLLALGLAISTSAQSGGPITELNIVNKEISPDGFARQGVLANGTMPGPIIKGNKGDNFQINVIDQLTNTTMNTSTTVHWHGIYQHQTNWADGPAFVTQCPIIAGNSFLYNFTVPDQAGTFWYHSHEGVQYCDGLRGPFIVYDPDDPHKDLYDVDDDTTVITLADWYHSPANDLLAGPVDADSVLINGLGRLNNSDTPVSVIEVEQGKRYRFRLISTSCHPYFNFSIEGHDNMTIIEADGQNTEPLPDIDSIQILAAQRYSFVLEANQPVGNYWIRAAPQTVVAGSAGTPTGLAILRYVNATAVDPTTDPYDIPDPQNPLLEQNLRSYGNVTVPPLDPDCDECDIVLNFSLNTVTGSFFVNDTTYLNASYVNPPVPVLLQILNGTYNAHDLMPANSVQSLPLNKTIQITMPGIIAGPHPLHLHGHSFFVIQSAGSDTPNTINPVRRDTVSIGTGPTNPATIRFVTDNPGPWFMHCHIDFHLAAGFALVMAEAASDVPDYVRPVPPAWEELCREYNSTNPRPLVA